MNYPERLAAKRPNAVTPAEAERLALLAEAMGESVRIIGRILRDGYESAPDEGAAAHREFLEHALGDVTHAIFLLCSTDDLDWDHIEKRSARRGLLLEAFLHHQGDAK